MSSAAGQTISPGRVMGRYQQFVWQDQHGLPQNGISAVAQTPDGYLWLATAEGVVRFDGVRFTAFDSGNTSEIKSNNVQALLTDHTGALWVGTHGGGLSCSLQEAFSRRLIASQEQERQRIAAGLHDSLGQNLLVIKNSAALARLTVNDLPAAFQQLDQIADSTMQAIQEVRQIAYNLRPHYLDSIGLTRSLEEMLRRVEEASGSGIACEIEPIDGALSKEAEINFYRIIQEAVSNIVKHARATRAGIEVEREEDCLLLTIRDNGCGFAVPEGEPPGGFGLAGMAERARILGGTYRVESAPDKGTTVVVELPISSKEKKQ